MVHLSFSKKRDNLASTSLFKPSTSSLLLLEPPSIVLPSSLERELLILEIYEDLFIIDNIPVLPQCLPKHSYHILSDKHFHMHIHTHTPHIESTGCHARWLSFLTEINFAIKDKCSTSMEGRTHIRVPQIVKL